MKHKDSMAVGFHSLTVNYFVFPLADRCVEIPADRSDQRAVTSESL